MWVWIQYSDGRFTLRESNAEGAKQAPRSHAEIDPLVWQAYQTHALADYAWQDHLRRIDNEAYEKAEREGTNV